MRARRRAARARAFRRATARARARRSAACRSAASRSTVKTSPASGWRPTARLTRRTATVAARSDRRGAAARCPCARRSAPVTAKPVIRIRTPAVSSLCAASGPRPRARARGVGRRRCERVCRARGAGSAWPAANAPEAARGWIVHGLRDGSPLPRDRLGGSSDVWSTRGPPPVTRSSIATPSSAPSSVSSSATCPGPSRRPRSIETTRRSRRPRSLSPLSSVALTLYRKVP